MPAAEKHQSVQAKHGCRHQSVSFVHKQEGISLDKAAAKKTPSGFQQASVPSVKGRDFRHIYWGFEFRTRHFP